MLDDDSSSDRSIEFEQNADPVITIDLGANSYVGLYFKRSKKAKIIPNDEGQRTIPSWVGFDELEG